MHRVLAATLALLASTPAVAVAQSFQFMTLGAHERTLLPFAASFRGYLASGDLDGDGDRDLVTTLSGGAGVFLRSGTGWLTPTITSLGGQSDLEPVLVDLDADGDRDVLFVSPNLTVQRLLFALENTPAGMVQLTLPSWLATTLFRGAAIGDLDADGLPDMVLSTHEGHVLPYMVARGRPGLQFAQDLTALPSGLQAGLWPVLLDADGDGDLDVLASSANSSLRLLRNAGGSFTNATSTLPPARAGHTFLLAADLDGDGRSDCAATLLNGDLDVLWGGAGGLTFAQAVASLPGLRWLSADDFDGDQDLDLLADHSSGIDVLWNQGNRQFTRSNVLSQRTALRGSADIDVNGIADIVFTTERADTVVRCKYEARIEDAAFTVGQLPLGGFAAPQSPPLAGDVDGDGRSDLVTPGQALLTVDHALGGGAYRRSTSAVPVSTGLTCRSELADMDGDGDLDVVVKDSARVHIARNDGSGSFTWSPPSPSASNSVYIDDLRVADMDGDGDRDLVLGDQLGVVLVRNLGSGQLAPAVVLVASGTPAACVEVADVDGDGDFDIITDRASGVGQEHVILANDGAGNFAPGAAFRVALGSGPFSVRAGDLDGDADSDLVVANFNHSTLHVHRNDGSGRFTDTTLADLPPGMSMPLTNVVLADFDGDGDLDAGAMTFGSALCLLLLNDGNGHFTDRSSTRGQPLGPAIFFMVLRAADLDGDGDVDLCAAGGGGFHFVLTNHLRQCRGAAAPRLGGVAEFLLFSGPGFGQPGLGMLGLAFAPPASPLQLPGVAGAFDLDPATLQVVGAVTTSSIGVSSAFVAVPQDPVLFSLGFWAQGVILPAVGAPGFTNAVYEVVLR